MTTTHDVGGELARHLDESGFELLYQRHYAGLVTLGTATVKDRALAEDMVQDAFATLWRKRIEVRDPLPWLRRVVVTNCFDAVRTSNRPVASNLPSQVPGNTEKVPGGSVMLSVQPGTVDGHSCFALVHRSDAGEVIESQDACGGGGGVTYAQNSLGGVSLVYSDDHGAVRAVVQCPGGRYERRLHAGYAIGPRLTPGTITTTTYRADGSVIAVHHETLDADGNLDYQSPSESGS